MSGFLIYCVLNHCENLKNHVPIFNPPGTPSAAPPAPDTFIPPLFALIPAIMAIRVVEFSSGGYKIRKIFA